MENVHGHAWSSAWVQYERNLKWSSCIVLWENVDQAGCCIINNMYMGEMCQYSALLNDWWPHYQIYIIRWIHALSPYVQSNFIVYGAVFKIFKLFISEILCSSGSHYQNVAFKLVCHGVFFTFSWSRPCAFVDHVLFICIF